MQDLWEDYKLNVVYPYAVIPSEIDLATRQCKKCELWFEISSLNKCVGKFCCFLICPNCNPGGRCVHCYRNNRPKKPEPI